MRLYLLILLIALPCVVLYLIYGRAYLWAYRATRWDDLDAAPAPIGDERPAGPAPLAARRKATRSERRALGMPMRSAILTVAVILSAFASIALLASQQPDLGVYGVVACVLLAIFVAVFVGLDRIPALGEVRGVRGLLSLPDDEHNYVPEGGMLVGGVPVLYPVHWLPLIQGDIGQSVDIELTEQGAVLRHGDDLKLDDETRRFDYRPWQPSGVIAAALVVLAAAGLFVFAPLGQRLEAAHDALDGHRLLSINDQAQWDAWRAEVGDEITVSGIVGDCAWNAPASGATIGLAGLHDCREVALDLSGTKPAIPALNERQQTAATLSLVLEQMLQTRRNATPEEVREHWRIAGQGGSQRWTLVSLAQVERAVDVLCESGACEARDVLAQARSAPPARISQQLPEALVMDSATARRVAQAGFAMAAITIDPLIDAAIQAAQTRHAGAARRLVSQTGMVLATSGTQVPLPDPRDQALVAAVGDQSPRLRMLHAEQALAEAGEHRVDFSGGVRAVAQDGATQVVSVDTSVRPVAPWMKLAPVLAWALLAILALGTSVMSLAQRKRQRTQLIAIRRHYANQVV